MGSIILGNPVRGPLHSKGWVRPAGNRDFKVTQYFGPKGADPAEPKVVWPGGDGIAGGTYPLFHQGVDLSNGDCGSLVVAAAAGVVDEARTDSAGVHRVIVRHGRYRTWYGHLADDIVFVGQSVVANQGIGHVGKTGATACHLHFGLEYLDFGVVTASKGEATWHNKFIDAWRRMAINVKVRPAGPGVNIRSSAGSGSTPGPLYAATRDDGHIHRATDGADLGLTSAMARWGGRVTGSSWEIAGVGGNTWERIYLGGAYRFIASPLAVRSV